MVRMAVAATNECAPDARPWVLAATILGSSMAFIDGSVVSVALPAMQGDAFTSMMAEEFSFQSLEGKYHYVRRGQ